MNHRYYVLILLYYNHCLVIKNKDFPMLIPRNQIYQFRYNIFISD